VKYTTLAQAFTGILLQVGAATQVLAEDTEATGAHLDTIEELARTGLTEARRSVNALRPQLLELGIYCPVFAGDSDRICDRYCTHLRNSG